MPSSSRVAGRGVAPRRTAPGGCGAGPVRSAPRATAASMTPGSTGSAVNCRTDRRSSAPAAGPSSIASAVPSQNRSSSPARTSVRGVGPVVAAAQPAHHRDRDAGELALHQIGGGGDLVGDGHLGDEEFVAVRVVGARVAVQHRQPGGADRGVGLPVAPGPPHGVGDDDADRDAEPLAQPVRSAAALPSGSTGSRASSPASTLDPSTPAAACTRPSVFSVISVRPLRASTRTASSSMSLRRSASRSSGSVGRGDDAALALGQHLAGDDQDVVIAQPRRGGGDRGGQIVAGPELGQPGHRAGSRSRAAGPCSAFTASTPARSSPAAHHLGGGRRIGHQQGDRSHLDARRPRRRRPRRSASRRGCRRRSAAP